MNIANLRYIVIGEIKPLSIRILGLEPLMQLPFGS
jgi:hypothetical protein